MSYFIILITCLLVLIISYELFKKDILSPTIVSCTLFSFSILCAIIGLTSWNYVSELNVTTLLIFVLGIISFFLGELICRKFSPSLKKNNLNKEKKKLNNISKLILILILIFTVITSILFMNEIINLCRSYGFKSNKLSEILSFYRSKTGLFSQDAYTGVANINFFVKQMQKVCNAFNIILFVYLITNIFNKEKKQDKINLVLTILTIILTLLQTILFNGGRSIMFHYIVAYIGIFIFYYFVIGKNKINKKITFSFLGISVVLVCVYYIMLPFLGRETKHDFIKYNTFSFGTSIPTLNQYIEKDNSKSNYIGEETFGGVYYTLNKLKIIKYTKPQTHEWYSYADNGTLSSNTFTSFRSYYKDFGIIGLVILQFIFGYLITLFYLKMKNSNSQICQIIYFNYFYVLIDQIRDEQFFSLINISTLANLLIIIVLYQVLVYLDERRIKNG